MASSQRFGQLFASRRRPPFHARAAICRRPGSKIPHAAQRARAGRMSLLMMDERSRPNPQADRVAAANPGAFSAADGIAARPNARSSRPARAAEACRADDSGVTRAWRKLAPAHRAAARTARGGRANASLIRRPFSPFGGASSLPVLFVVDTTSPAIESKIITHRQTMQY